MDKQQLLSRLELIEKDLKQINANFNLLEGCKQECMYWINLFESKEKEEQSNQSTNE